MTNPGRRNSPPDPGWYMFPTGLLFGAGGGVVVVAVTHCGDVAAIALGSGPTLLGLATGLVVWVWRWDR